jgi:hypothetical protein
LRYRETAIREDSTEKRDAYFTQPIYDLSGDQAPRFIGGEHQNKAVAMLANSRGDPANRSAAHDRKIEPAHEFAEPFQVFVGHRVKTRLRPPALTRNEFDTG